MSPSTFSKDEKVLFFHIVLNTSVNMFHDDENLPGTETKSLYFIFLNGQLVEKVMKEMGYHLHIVSFHMSKLQFLIDSLQQILLLLS